MKQRLKTLKGSNNQPRSTLSGSEDVTDWFRGLRAKPLALGYSLSSFQDGFVAA
jgi:hypothetical protein